MKFSGTMVVLPANLDIISLHRRKYNSRYNRKASIIPITRKSTRNYAIVNISTSTKEKVYYLWQKNLQSKKSLK